ncbi:MAG: hypothetical protein LBG48_03195 [Rickettsiales bacterium]|jgi:hypothetical protein|nr:hypothetical protein [Rickettsiales bacterium]
MKINNLFEKLHGKFDDVKYNKFVVLTLGIISVFYFPVIIKNILYFDDYKFIPFYLFHSSLSGFFIYLLLYSLKIFRYNDWAVSLSFGLIAPFSTIRSTIYFIFCQPERRRMPFLVLDFFCFGKIFFLVFLFQLFVLLFPYARNIALRLRFWSLFIGFLSPLTYWILFLLP